MGRCRQRAGGDQRFGVRYRIKRNSEIARAFERGRRASDSLITLRALRSPEPRAHSRLAVSVGRKYGNAVRRNRIKRLCREAFRLVRCDLPVGYDYVILPHKTARPTLAKLMASICALAPRAVAGGASEEDRP